MLSLGAPCLVRIERDRDDRAATGTGSDDGLEPLSAHDLILTRLGLRYSDVSLVVHTYTGGLITSRAGRGGSVLGLLAAQREDDDDDNHDEHYRAYADIHCLLLKSVILTTPATQAEESKRPG
jgi:hypothetical protein